MTPDEREQLRAGCIATALGLFLWVLGVLIATGHLTLPPEPAPVIVIEEPQ